MTEQIERAIPPPRCPHRRKAKVADFLKRLLFIEIDRRCYRYMGHEQFGYKCQDRDMNEWTTRT